MTCGFHFRGREPSGKGRKVFSFPYPQVSYLRRFVRRPVVYIYQLDRLTNSQITVGYVLGRKGEVFAYPGNSHLVTVVIGIGKSNDGITHYYGLERLEEDDRLELDDEDNDDDEEEEEEDDTDDEDEDSFKNPFIMDS